MSHARSILLAGLLVLSTVVTGVGPVLAQSTETATDNGPVTQTFETGPHKVRIDLFDVSSETTITVITDESPAGDNTAILRKTVSGSHNSAHLRNAGAYEKFTIRVEGADGPVSFSKGGVTNAWKPGDDGKFLGDTGGDAGFTYDLSEQIGESVMPQVVQLDRTGLPDSTTINTTGTDAQQVETDIYQSALNQQAQSENFQTTLNNYLSDTKTQARIIGKNAYIRALNNGSSKSAAKTASKSAVEDYYATKQVQLYNEYEANVLNWDYLNSIARDETGVTSVNQTDVNSTVGFDNTDGGGSLKYLGTSQAGFTLVNNSAFSYTTVGFQASGGGNTKSWQAVPAHKDPAADFWDSYLHTSGTGAYGLQVRSSVDDGEPVNVRWMAYVNLNSEIESQAQTVKGDMDTLADNTYSAYQNGEINSSDLVDPYVLASQQSAGDDFQGWTAAQLTLMGQNSPANFDQIGSFNISTESGKQYEGVLFSQENPASGQFENGSTYDTANIGGTQYVVTSDQIVELDGTFTIDRITTMSGETTENVTIQKTTYKTTNVTELKQQYEDLAQKRAEIEAREQNLRGSAGGGLLGGSSSSLVLALLGVGALYAVSQRRTGGNS
ncbi:hypothetical protein RBH20_09195 [Haloarcula sp. H-GB4]|uniref:hypothetical protein n=1 Tax=Haloarcula sp. H-GB4 TaxID=3069755 RepID=UPI0027B7D78C|nr:hypothetical protein [Haloarcula sp. H-GB4]MDQ2072709.1 hypothetical protein [Haloarcula sp. H-GB4]